MSDARSSGQGDLARTALQLVALGALVVASLWIVKPFLLAGIWAATLAIATWPLLLRAQAWLFGRRALANALLTIVLLLILVIPLYLGIHAIVVNVDQIEGLSQSLATWSVPQPPDWLERIPLVGAKLASEWSDIASASSEELTTRVAPYARDAAAWFVGQLGSIGALFVHFLLTVVLTALLYANGERAADGVLRFARRLAGERGESAARLAAAAVRAVALGIVVTATIQSALVALGFAVVGMPYAAILTAVSFLLAVAQIGPLPVLIGAVIWVYSTQGAGWGTGYLIWAVICGSVDNVVRPVLIKRGADLPLLLIFAGVIGGLLAFGVVGLFIGPVVLAVAYTLLLEWMNDGEAA
jgi:predicted PurR-regulated permease PerM